MQCLIKQIRTTWNSTCTLCLISSLYTVIEYSELEGSLIHNWYSQNKSLFIFTYSPQAVSLNEVNVLNVKKIHLLQKQEQF